MKLNYVVKYQYNVKSALLRGGFRWGEITPEGRILNQSGTLVYEYSLKDHLGNNRVTYKLNAQNQAVIVQTASYYPFGLAIQGLSSYLDANPYLYNGKELHTEVDLDWLDLGFRFYDPVIGRFPSLDPLADKFYWVSPYNYAENSPIANIDLWGLQKVYYTVGMDEAIHVFTPLQKAGYKYDQIRTAAKYAEEGFKISEFISYDIESMNTIRHAVGQALVTKHVDEKAAQLSGDAHEHENSLEGNLSKYYNQILAGENPVIEGNDLSDSFVDLLNNIRGREIGNEAAKLNLNDKKTTESVIDAFDKGELYIREKIGMNEKSKKPIYEIKKTNPTEKELNGMKTENKKYNFINEN